MGKKAPTDNAKCAIESRQIHKKNSVSGKLSGFSPLVGNDTSGFNHREFFHYRLGIAWLLCTFVMYSHS